MKAPMSRVLALGVVTILAAVFAARAEDTPAPPLDLGGTYEVNGVSSDDQNASMNFKATITNNGASDVAGQLVLRHPNVVGKVWARFGQQTIRAGTSVMVMANVTVPRGEYDGWMSGGSPAVFFYTQNDRGDVKTYRISMSRIDVPVPSN